MKIQLVSDLHMEFAPIDPITNAGADILVLSGDILVAERFKRSEASPYFAQASGWRTWMEATCADFEQVFFILGNHEHYDGNFYETYDILRDQFAHIQNLTILDNMTTHYHGFGIFGGTLWTDFDHDNFKAMLVRDGLNDYKLIKGRGYRKLMPSETQQYHVNSLRKIEGLCGAYDRVLVFGHHGPSYQSISREYRGSPLNPGYVSHLDRFIEGHSQVKLWTHGHVHSSHDYVIGDTRIVANPRGYAHLNKTGAPENADFDPNLVITV